MLPCSLHYLNLIWGFKKIIIDIVDTILFFKMSSATPQALQVFTQALHIIPQSVWCELHYKKPSQCQYQRPSWQTGPLLLLWSESLPQTPFDSHKGQEAKRGWWYKWMWTCRTSTQNLKNRGCHAGVKMSTYTVIQSWTILTRGSHL